MDFREESTGYVVNLCARLITQRLSEALGPFGVAPAQMSVLLALEALGEGTQRELAEMGAVEQPTMAQTLGRLERDGLVYRTSDQSDKRKAIVRLTDRARALLPLIEAIATSINNEAVRGLRGANGKMFVDLAAQVAANLRNVDAISLAVAHAIDDHLTPESSAATGDPRDPVDVDRMT